MVELNYIDEAIEDVYTIIQNNSDWDEYLDNNMQAFVLKKLINHYIACEEYLKVSKLKLKLGSLKGTK